MKKFGILVIIILLLLIIWHSGALNDEKIVGAIEKGIRMSLDWMERAMGFVIEKIK